MRLIPRKIKVKTEFFKNVTLGDIIIAFVSIGVAIALFTANFEYHIWVAVGWLIITSSLFFPVADGIRFYYTLGYLFRFFAQKKKYIKDAKKESEDIKQIIPFVDLVQNRFIDFKEYYGEVIEITPIEFSLLNNFKQNNLVETFGNALRRLSENQSASIVKLSKAMILDNYIYLEDKKYDSLLDLQYEGEMAIQEVEARANIFEDRVSKVESLNRQEKVYKDHFYLVVYDKDKELLDTTVNGIISTLSNSVTPVSTRKLVGKDLVIFLKATFGKEFDERELEGISMSNYMNWVIPSKLKFKTAGYTVDNNKSYRQYVISDYPLQVNNAWGFNLFSQDRTKIIVKIKPIQKYKAERNIDKAILEMQSKGEYSARSSAQIENQTHIQTLKDLLIDLKNNNQQLYDVNTFICCEETARKEVKAILKQEGFKYSELFGRQVDGFISANISMRDNIKETLRGIQTTSLAAIFPFISGQLQDKEGFYIGYNEYPVFIDFFLRNRERVNSNMMVIGKSGSGKSFAAKNLLVNFAADNTKIFILDPEDEYTILAGNMKGKVIDVGSSAMGIINPFHIITTLKDDVKDINEIEEEEEEKKDDGKLRLKESTDTFSTHLQFLEQFFKVILQGIDSDAFEALNSLVVEVYNEKGIDGNTDLNKLGIEDYPIFDDLYRTICNRLEKEKNEYRKRNLLTIQTYIKKFATGGRNSNLWNGPTSITTKENFVSFNFRSLLANRNEVIANAQMLLVFRYLDNEIIKNRDFNIKFKTNRKIVVVVDEAHIFINPDYPIALDFMTQMAKRIRKYSGMQIIITQNVKDFVGTPEIQRQSTAVINASQYSMIFSLAPNDLNDLVELYRKSGEINEQEQNSIVTAGVGQCFFISGPMSRTMLQVEASDRSRALFE